MNRRVTIVSSTRRCDLDGQPAVADASVTVLGRRGWASVCELHFLRGDATLGEGCGQQYITAEAARDIIARGLTLALVDGTPCGPDEVRAAMLRGGYDLLP